jgi:hypothetical protein
MIALMAFSTLGCGAGILHVLRILPDLGVPERWAWSFAIGFGGIGWLIFFLGIAGHISTFWVTSACVALLPGLVFLLRPAGGHSIDSRVSRGERVQLAIFLLGALLAAAFDLIESLAPPTDADSLAYHFALPKLFIESNRLVFVPRANDGAIPLLQQMTYLAAMKMGGERALTLWTMLTGWGASFLMYALLRRHVTALVALAGTLVLLTTPVVVYGAGSGQVEIRNAMFVMLAAAGTAEALRTGRWQYAALAGLSAGFYAASKYPGLLYAFACGVAMLCRYGWLKRAAVYSSFLLIAGFQWYLWNWWHTGDPVFPLLFSHIEYAPNVPWSAAQDAYYHAAYDGAERVLSVDLLHALLYPFYVTFSGNPAFEAGPVGFGPFVVVMLPAAIIGLSIKRRSIAQSPLTVFAGLCLAGYLLWFFLGPSQRVRFFLPIYPLLLILVIVAVARAIESAPRLAFPIASVFAAVVLFQLVLQGVFSINFIKRLAQGESRDAFIMRNIGRYAAMQYANRHLNRDDTVLTPFRQLVYFAEGPVFYAHPIVEARVETRPDSRNAALFWRQLKAQQVTHILDTPANSIPQTSSTSGLPHLISELLGLSCAKEVNRVPVAAIGSRTFPTLQTFPQGNVIYRLTPETCPLSAHHPQQSHD